MRRAWTEAEILRYLQLHARGIPADGIACGIPGRTRVAILAMNRKLKRLGELGVKDGADLVRLLALNDGFLQGHTLAAIRRRAARPGVPVRAFVRRGRLYGLPGMVEAHTRGRQGA
jgi:hypothetical protein